MAEFVLIKWRYSLLSICGSLSRKKAYPKFCFDYGIFIFANVYIEARNPQLLFLQKVEDLRMQYTIGHFANYGKKCCVG